MNYDPQPYVYKVNGRMGYYAVDPVSTGENAREIVHEAVFAGSKKDAESVAYALNMAFYRGTEYGRLIAKKEEETEGYKNYPTAQVSIWLHNDKDIFRDCANLALGAEDIRELSDFLKEHISISDAYVRDGDIGSPFAEFISYCLSMTDWYGLAKEIWDEVRGNK